MTVYKYVVPERLDVLRNARIRFTQPAALNDPFELRPYFESVVDETELLDHIARNPVDLTPHLLEAYESAPPETRAALTPEQWLEFARTALASEEGREVYQQTLGAALGTIQGLTGTMREQVYAGFGERVGILSLSEAPDVALMWSHYADSHRGFVIGFDEGHPFFDGRRGPEDDFFHLRPVTYRPPVAYASITDIDGEAFFLSKAPEWSYERERRVVVPVDPAAPTFVTPEGDAIHLREFPPEAVECIVVGARGAPVLHDALAELVATDGRYRHVRLLRAVLDARRGGVRIEPDEAPGGSVESG